MILFVFNTVMGSSANSFILLVSVLSIITTLVRLLEDCRSLSILTMHGHTHTSSDIFSSGYQLRFYIRFQKWFSCPLTNPGNRSLASTCQGNINTRRDAFDNQFTSTLCFPLSLCPLQSGSPSEMDGDLRCNRLTCRRPLIDKAVVVSLTSRFPRRIFGLATRRLRVSKGRTCS
jgi:hypothetical protein